MAQKVPGNKTIKMMQKKSIPKFFKNPVLIIVLGIICLISIVPIIALINPNNKRIKGNPSLFDPIGQYETVKQFAGGDDFKLGSIEAYYVKRDGTLDLYAKYKPNVRYKFYKQIKIKKNKDIRYKAVTVKITKPYHLETWSHRPGHTKGIFHLGMFKESYYISVHPKTFKRPNCSLKKIWDYVIEIEKDIPQNTVAIIDYKDGKFTFHIKNRSSLYIFDSYGLLIERR
jgi:hypothetical protein